LRPDGRGQEDNAGNFFRLFDSDRTVSQTKLAFPTEGNWRYRIEISNDGETNWRLVADQTRTTDTAKERTDTVQDNAPRGRFLRVTFAGTPDTQTAALAEIELTGTMNQQ